MRMLKPVIALDPRLFGRRFPGFILGSPEEPSWAISDDLKLFASTFAAGFLFVSVLIL
ncbi:hypothetical protein LZ016_02040 [Sphingomonas sp. SM33]|jgi:hypothetical protein|uniref:Uncharacterized protein n=1 Tax=Sphingomonas telluris TaxID=2907998 RepID=A0ABS9VIT3_9SPHN|nr:hypothetical protein [Sphingomonas telluris]MCH8614886.1 hypothetical protein [Sphingomonas telluris]